MNHLARVLATAAAIPAISVFIQTPVKPIPHFVIPDHPPISDIGDSGGNPLPGAEMDENPGLSFVFKGDVCEVILPPDASDKMEAAAFCSTAEEKDNAPKKPQRSKDTYGNPLPS